MNLHLGSGREFIDGWINIDLGAISDREDYISWDLSCGLPSHFADESVDFIFSQHFLEHITRDAAVRLLRDCHRKLKLGGVVRIVVPDLRVCVQRYLDNNLYKGGDGAYAPKSGCIMMNDAFRMWGHQFMYDRQEIVAVLEEAGFGWIRFPDWRKSAHKELCDLDSRSQDDLIVEAQKR